MSRVVAAVLTALFALVELLAPGKALYHYGWYNALAIAFAGFVALGARTGKKSAIALAIGAAFFALATAASGLLGPDTSTIAGAPGSAVPVSEIPGTLRFPPAATGANDVELQRGSRLRAVGRTPALLTTFALWQQPRTVVLMEARDASGNRLTITQPTGSVFLSPVLLMQTRSTVAGMVLPVDGFALPGVDRSVKAVLFNRDDATRLNNARIGEGPAVLFAVTDASGRIARNGIALGRSGAFVRAGGVALRGTVTTFPAITIASIPYLPALAGGLIAFALAGAWRRGAS